VKRGAEAPGVDHRPDAFDGTGIAVIGRVGPEEAEWTRQPLASVDIVPVIVAGAPDIDHDERSVINTVMLFQRGAKVFALQNGLLALDLFVGRKCRLRSFASHVNSDDGVGG